MRWVVPAVALLLLPLVQAVPVPTGDVEFHFYRDEAESAYVVSPDGAAAYSTGFWGSSSVYPNTGRDWAFVFVDLDGPFRLDPAGSIQVTAYVGGGDQEAGTASVGWELIVDGSVAASGGAKDVTYTQAAEEVSWTESAPDVQVKEGDVFRVFTSDHIGKGGRMDLEPSSLVLPVLEGAGVVAEPPVGYQDITGEAFDLSFTNATEIQHLNWTVQRDAGDFVAVWDVRNGSLNLTVTGPDNQTVHQGEAAGAGNTTAAVEAAAGVWRITLRAIGLTGDVAFTVAAVEEPEEEEPGQEETSTTAPTGTTTGTQQSTTGNGTLDDGSGKESPGLPLLVVVAGLVAAVRRRR